MIGNGKSWVYIDQKTEVCSGVYRGIQEEMGCCADVQGDSDRVQGEVMWGHVQVGGGVGEEGVCKEGWGSV